MSTALPTDCADLSKRVVCDPAANISLQYFALISLSRLSPTSDFVLSHMVVTSIILEEVSEYSVPQKSRNAAIVLADGAVIRLSVILWRYRIPVTCCTPLPEIYRVKNTYIVSVKKSHSFFIHFLTFFSSPSSVHLPPTSSPGSAGVSTRITFLSR